MFNIECSALCPQNNVPNCSNDLQNVSRFHVILIDTEMHSNSNDAVHSTSWKSEFGISCACGCNHWMRVSWFVWISTFPVRALAVFIKGGAQKNELWQLLMSNRSSAIKRSYLELSSARRKNIKEHWSFAKCSVRTVLGHVLSHFPLTKVLRIDKDGWNFVLPLRGINSEHNCDRFSHCANHCRGLNRA